MKMKLEDYQKALSIIVKSNSIQVSFNVPVKDNYSNTHDILIHRSNAAVISDLVGAGFSLCMTDKGLSVSKI